MECKNCKTNLKETAKFCDECGGKIINHRLNFKIVTEEFLETFISWDNKFFKTFIHMFTKPQEVITCYLNGVRKRYMQPFSYMIIALTLYGLFLFIAKDSFQEYMYDSANYFKQNNENSAKFMDEFGKKLQNFTMNYYNIITLSMLPFFSLINILIFRKKLNFIEHNVSLLYSYAQYQYIFLIIAVTSILAGINLSSVMLFTMLFLLVYHMYIYYKMFHLSLWQILYKTIFFLLILSVLFIVLEIVIMIFFFLFTDVFNNLIHSKV